ncbi:CoA transferase [Streptomyces sp. NBC_00988]|uniref:CaiB/BaiF CoA transferase family protein n=1 Tax=Streptomyces sp. NBC_00988 TaxID=2903704 RepID=UPI003862EE33|nr:CoA transferase [Streptomyces sp. NBC_00988]
MGSAPLAGMRVLDLSRVLAGPWAGQVLADLGADVIKVERPGAGDDTRSWGPPFLTDSEGRETSESAYFLGVNRAKRSVTVDLKTEQGRQIIRTLASRSDVVIENFKTGTLERMGLGYESLRELNPRLVHCSVTGFGQTGPRRHQAAYDFAVQALGGLMSVTGERDGEPGAGPQKVGIPIVDLTTGLYAAIAVLAAVAHRNETGAGDHIDLSMLDVQVSLLSNQAMNYLLTGRSPQRQGNRHPNIQPQDVYRCRDGQVAIAVGNDGQFRSLCRALKLDGTVPRFARNRDRVRNLPELQELIATRLTDMTRQECVSHLEAAGVPCAPINTVAEVFDDPQVVHRRMLREVDHPYGVPVPQVAGPLRFRDAVVRYDSPPPLVGQHTDEVLHAIGLDDARIAELRAQGAI